MKTVGLIYVFVSVWVLAIWLSLPSQAAQTELRINLTVTQPTCEVAQNGLLTGNLLDFGDINPEDISGNPPPKMQKSFDLTLSCNTTGSPGQRPKLKMSGTTLTNGDNGSRPYLFNQGGNNAAQLVGFIVALNTTTPITWHITQGNDTEIDLSSTDGGAAPNSIPIQVGISKGDNHEPVVAGELKAAVTFTFRYG